jgi:hypothetical protein
MGHFEDIKIDRSEGWKYSSTHGTNGDDYHARVYVDDKGEISKDSYSREYNDKNGNNEKPEKPDKKGNDKKGNDKNGKGKVEKEKESWLKKILLAPFRLLWWIIKKLLKLLCGVVKLILGIVTLGMLDSILNPKEDA